MDAIGLYALLQFYSATKDVVLTDLCPPGFAEPLRDIQVAVGAKGERLYYKIKPLTITL